MTRRYDSFGFRRDRPLQPRPSPPPAEAPAEPDTFAAVFDAWWLALPYPTRNAITQALIRTSTRAAAELIVREWESR
jgi:hypothetical protein